MSTRIASASVSLPDSATIDGLLALFAQGRLADASILASELTIRFPAYGFGWKALAITLQVSGQVERALAAMLEAARLLPDDAEAHNNLGLVLIGLTRAVDAEQALHRALALTPDYAEAHNNLAIALFDQGRLSAALTSLHSALSLKPDYVKALNNLGLVLQAQGKSSEAAAAYRRALTLHPLYADAHSNLLFSLSQNERIDAAMLAAEHGRYAERFEAPLRPHWPAHANRRDPARVLRIGVVSGDLRDHPVAAFIEPVLARLGASAQLSLHAYSNHPVEDAVTRRLRAHFKDWTSIVGVDDNAVAVGIQNDGIDVLLDLSGHTAHNRLPVFARKPAPLQASWIGYPCTTGLTAMDYYLTDAGMLPPGQFDDQFSEQLLQLPLAAPFQISPLAPPVNQLPALANGYITFGSFNRPSKLSRPVIALWSRLLRALPSARMLVAAMPADGGIDELAALFALNGVARRRLDFFKRADMAQYLALHHRVDVCLDTFPYSGGTTTMHALTMGVPTLTLTGRTAPGRQGASNMTHIGLAGFVAADADDFLAIGAALPRDLGQLAAIRAGLPARFKAQRLASMDAVGANVELALRTVWQRWCAGLPPISLRIGATEPNT